MPGSPALTSHRHVLPPVASARCRARGDLADPGHLYDRHLPEAFTVCRRYMAPPHEDAQNAATQLFEHLMKVLRAHAPDNFPAWLHTTAHNHCLMQLRACKRAGPRAGPLLLSFHDAADVALAAGAADEAEEAEQRLQSIEAALAQRPPAQRRCLELFYLEKKSFRDIAAETGLALNLVRSHLQNGKRMLRRQLEPPEKSKLASHYPRPTIENLPLHAAR